MIDTYIQYQQYNFMNLKSLLTSCAIAGIPALAFAAGVQKNGIERANLDESVTPGMDFYQYACGGWQKAHPLTPEYARFGTFDMLRENNRIQLQELITNLGENPDCKKKGSVAQKVSDLYMMGMDSVH